MSLKGADLRETLQAFGMIGGREVIVDDAVSGSLTIEIQDAPWSVVLDEACNLSGCRIEWGTSALRILPADPASTPGSAAMRIAIDPETGDLIPITADPDAKATLDPELAAMLSRSSEASVG